jgi:hypothetical protein
MNMKRELEHILCVLVACAVAGASAPAQTVSLDADYVGTAGWHTLSFPRSAFSASGTSPAALSGLITAGISSEGSVAFDGGYEQNDGLGSLHLSAPNGDEVASASLTGQGTVHHYAGTFAVTGGKGRFAGATGSGTFLIEAGTYAPDYLGDPLAPATLSIRGTVTAPAIPEPGTLALLAGPLTFVAGRGLKRRRLLIAR